MSFSEFHSEFESENELPFVLPDQDDLDFWFSFNPSIQMSNPYEWESKQSFPSVIENDNL